MSTDAVQSHISYMFGQVNSLKRSFIYLMESKETDKENFELNIYRALGRLELQLRGLQKEVRVTEES